MHRICLFESGTTGWGGSFKSCFLIASILKKKGYSVIIGYVNKSEYWKSLERENVATFLLQHILYNNEAKKKFRNRLAGLIINLICDSPINLFFFLTSLIHRKFISKVSGIVKNNKVDLIHTNSNFQRDLDVIKIAKDFNLSVICHLRTAPYHNLTRAEKSLVAYNKITFIAISEIMRKRWVTAGLPKNKIQLIYNAQPEIKKRNHIKVTREINHPPVRLLYVGRLVKNKGLDILLSALPSLNSDKWSLSIVGEGEEENTLKKLSTDLGLSNRVIFYGYQKEIEKFYSSHDILVVPSLEEPFGRIIIEAMQFEMAVVASNAGGPSEIIENEKDGLLFEPGNVHALKQAVDELMENPQKRFLLGQAGKERQKIFSEKVFTEKLMNLYEKAL